jgi:ABC-type polysaccharide/polyol phosphate transport system ATPase subunit
LPTSSDGTVTATRVWKRFHADPGRALLRDKIDSVQARLSGRTKVRWRWALQDVNFRAEPGDSVGLIGANGAGKSTLLKVLTRVMYPYAGTVEVHGRVGALIEVRAGIHPELTGRENVYLYGSLLGLPRPQVTRRFDAIVEFAQLESAIDRQVKFYSSGMQMRLGFAVAAFLEPDVLFVDEVLAVGDAAFQQRCLERMGQVLAKGTTLVLVSHDMSAIEAMCRRAVWIDDGVVRSDGPVREVVNDYRRSIEEYAEAHADTDAAVRLTRMDTSGDGGSVMTHHALHISFSVESHEAHDGWIYLGVSEGAATPAFLISAPLRIEIGETKAQCTVPNLPLPRGRYFVWTSILDADDHDLLPWHPMTSFDVIGPDLDNAPRTIVRLAPIHVETVWTGNEG